MVATSVASGYGLPPYDLLNLTSNSTQKCLEPPTVISSFVRQMQCTSHLHPSFRWKEQSLIFPPCRRHPFLCKQLRTLLFRASRLRQQRRPCRTSLIRLFELKVPAPIAFQSNQQPPTLPSDDVTKWHFRFRLPSTVSLSVLSHVLRI